jgi:hypothetical protein
MRSKGTGWFMENLIREARERNDHDMVLEVIEQNEYAVKLYPNVAFTVCVAVSLVARMPEQTKMTHEIDLCVKRQFDLGMVYQTCAAAGGRDDRAFESAGACLTDQLWWSSNPC